jgi:tungstate transport system substrate-binding protein
MRGTTRTFILLAISAVAVALLLSYAFLNLGGGVVRVRVSTTTSLYATGLADYLASRFNSAYPEARVEFIAVGSGAALKLAEKRDVCAVLIHEPGLEKQYIDKGVISGRKIFAYNYFVLVGPAGDPAGISNSSNLVEAFKKIYYAGEGSKALFISRGDNSGTHVRELRVWGLAGLSVEGAGWYLNCGCGMSEALVMANELGAYTLSDVGTYLKLENSGRLGRLRILYENKGDNLTINVYSAYVVEGCSGLEKKYAELFVNFIYENQRELIGSFGVNEYGRPLFYPAKDKELIIQELWDAIASGLR